MSAAIESHCRELEAQRRDIDSLHERMDAVEKRVDTLTDAILHLLAAGDARDWGCE